MYGTWALIIMVHTGFYQIESMPMWIYPDESFGYAECLLDKEKLNKTTVQKYRFDCARLGEI